MKIYVSDKENIDLSKNCFLTFSTKDKESVDWNVLAQSLEQHDKELRLRVYKEAYEQGKFDVKADLEYKRNLEQHEQEIRKPLIDAIVKLNEFIFRLISEKEPETAREITERHHREIMLGRQNKFLEEEIERLKKQLDLNDKEHFKNALKQLRETDYDTIRKAERQKAIAELEEWANTCHLVESIYEGVYCIDKDDLKEKLNEMKGD